MTFKEIIADCSKRVTADASTLLNLKAIIFGINKEASPERKQHPELLSRPQTPHFSQTFKLVKT